MKTVNLILLLICFSYSIAVSAQKRVAISDFGVNEQTIDATPGLIRALDKCKKSKASELIFEKGTYHFYPENGTDKYCFVSNNDEGLKRIAFYLEGLDGLTIDGQGSQFIFHGFINPFVVENSKRITFKNFSIDVNRPFHSEGIILANNPDGVDLEIPQNFPYKIHNGILVFTNNRESNKEKELIYPYGYLLEFDTEKRETAFMVHDYYLNDTPLRAEHIGERKVRVFLDGLKGTVGNTLVFGTVKRHHPGFVISDTRDVLFDNITIHHAGGMGIIGQRAHNVTVTSCRVTPSEGRMISATADATHFTNCTGKIEISNCLFENQMDDATNIHGIYVQIREIVSPNEVIVQLKHTQQLGFDFLKKGTSIEFVHAKSLITEGISKVTAANRINKELTRIRFADPLPANIRVGDAIGEASDFAEVHIHNNYIGKNRARGMLLNCRAKTLVENNVFHSPGAAILFEGDASDWFEQGGVKDCVIRNNVFDNCLFGVWGQAVIDVKAGITENREASRYNKNIQVYDNTFKLFDNMLLLHAYCMDNLRWENNTIERTEAYPSIRTEESYFKIENCSNMNIKQD